MIYLSIKFAPKLLRMRKLGFIAAVVFLAACSNAEQKADNAAEEPIEEEVEAVVQNATYGAEIDGSSAKPSSGLLAELQASEIDSIQTTVVGTIEKVCQVKGCWMTMKVSDDESMHVSFKDYGFFVPKDIDGKECVISGYAHIETMSVEELRHYAEDEGKSEEEIAQITEPETSLSFVADGVIVKDYAVAEAAETTEAAMKE